MMKLPEDFLFGGATAAYQAEGATQEDGKGKVPWDDYLKKEGRFSPDPACDFYHQYPKDLELSEKFGINAIRVSIAWSRIFPEGYGRIEPRGVEFYHKLFKECRKHGVEPFVTLHHFDSPSTISEQGDWLNEKNIQRFVEYAKFCFEEYQDEVKYWITINEPTSMSSQQYVTGTFPPGEKNNFNKCFQAEHNMNLAHARVVNMFKKNGYKGEIGVVHALQTVYPNSESEEDKHAAALQDTLDIRCYLDGTLNGNYSKETMSLMNEILDSNHQAHIKIKDEEIKELTKAADQMDFLGVNYYFSKFIKAYHGTSEIKHNGTGKKGSSVSRLQGIGEQVNRTDIPMTDWDWPIYPKGMYDMLMRIKKEYPKNSKIYITENGLGYKDHFIDADTPVDDQPRIDYLHDHLVSVAKAIQAGVNIKGYFVWSLQDMFSWTNGYSKRYGLFYVDFKTQKRYPKKSAYWYQKLSETKELK
ncbi:6-phospho-beta-galactosidase [Pediococcus ethanolidurans]|uniref:6-phospho-beta-galactosidase n=1 Tax=Pediococcus ethanolidurans TaxID=319653 RepID=A0A0R2JX03_9LACO|nr:6-phospho-beta-galactosidase [Pediococcus ethanolidurans]KRN81662.1 6-phospho-beta-galactosidase [Pediococcus ethanolidurans]GEN95814.1 6-phospho-beta-galactosidase [Pediococcus ethanolidurans]SER85713.1 6-phospho-beta-galactosidase [Pediococcus ethanolidurans]